MLSRGRLRRLVFLDESASNERTGYRKRGWSPVGVDCTDLVTTKWFTRWSVLPALTINGYLPDPLIFQGSITQAMFNWFVAERVLPYLQPGMVIVLDNASIHKDLALKALIEAAGMVLVFLPPYSPELNPIEQTFNTLKAWIRRNAVMAQRFSDYGAFLGYAVEHAIGAGSATVKRLVVRLIEDCCELTSIKRLIEVFLHQSSRGVSYKQPWID